jgi:hypothetical protein
MGDQAKLLREMTVKQPVSVGHRAVVKVPEVSNAGAVSLYLAAGVNTDIVRMLVDAAGMCDQRAITLDWDGLGITGGFGPGASVSAVSNVSLLRSGILNPNTRVIELGGERWWNSRTATQRRSLVNELRAVQPLADLWVLLRRKIDALTCSTGQALIVLPARPESLVETYAAMKAHRNALSKVSLSVAVSGVGNERDAALRLSVMFDKYLGLDVRPVCLNAEALRSELMESWSKGSGLRGLLTGLSTQMAVK